MGAEQTAASANGPIEESLGRECRPHQPVEHIVHLPGLRADVEILRDEWGVPHIFSTCKEDLFVAQGFTAAADRLYQMEIWRRARTGNLSEILGSEFIERDRLARLMAYRGDRTLEWAGYPAETRAICSSFAAGVNAYIESCAGDLPIEFTLLNFRPSPWKPEDCLLREFSPRITFNAQQELARTELMNAVGLQNAIKYLPTDPPRLPTLTLDANLSNLTAAILSGFESEVSMTPTSQHDGSNCWAVSGDLTSSGRPLLASDPHRPLLLPPLRYVCHLVAPGWNVIGAGEPTLPGVALGHNERIAFGFTVAQFDQTDLYIETTSEPDTHKYLVEGEWVEMVIVVEEIHVKGRLDPVRIELKYTRHGPVIWEDHASNRTLAIKWAGVEPGSAPYLGCLGVDQAHDWRSFCDALRYWKMPSETMTFADVDGNIGRTAVGLLPIRGWDGLLPVAGHRSEWEWEGFVAVDQMPREYNPPCGFVVSANENITPQECPFHIGFDWKPPYRVERIRSFLKKNKKFSLADFAQLQTDEFSLQAVRLLRLAKPFFQTAPAGISAIVRMLSEWDCVLACDSVEATLFEIWLAQLKTQYMSRHVEPAARSVIASHLHVDTVLGLIEELDVTALERLLLHSLMAAFEEVVSRFGPDSTNWTWGSIHTLKFTHPLTRIAPTGLRLDIGKFSCGGDDETVNSTRGPNHSCNYGPSYRQLLDLSDWDRSLFINLPGQSGDPESVHYSDHVPLWAKRSYAPLLYTRTAIEKSTKERLVLRPLACQPVTSKNNASEGG